MPVKIGSKLFICKIGGYTGKTETGNPIDDIANGYMIWLTKEQSRKVGKIGSKVTVTIGGKRFTGEIIGGPHGGRWGRYSARLKKILLDTRVGEKLSRVEIARLHRQALAMKGR